MLDDPWPDVGSPDLHRIDAEHWIVEDLALRHTDPRRVIAYVHETENDEVEVVWLRGDIPLPTRYREAADVIGELGRWWNRKTGMTRPIEIPHLPPLGR